MREAYRLEMRHRIPSSPLFEVQIIKSLAMTNMTMEFYYCG